MKKRNRNLGNFKKRKVNFEQYFKELKKLKDLRKKINYKDTYEGIFGNKEINTCEEILIRKYMLYELRDSYNYADDLNVVVSRMFSDIPDKDYVKKERKDDTTFWYYEPKVKELLDGTLGESFSYFGSDNNGEWISKTVKVSKCVRVFWNADEYSRGTTLWIKFHNENKSLDDIEAIAHKRVLDLKKGEKEDYENKSSFEKEVIELYKQKKEKYKRSGMPYTRQQIKEEVNKIKSEYNQEIAFSYFPELFELEIIKKISKQYKIDMHCSEYIYNMFRKKGFSNLQWNNAIMHYLSERQKYMERNKHAYFYYGYHIRENGFYN